MRRLLFVSRRSCETQHGGTHGSPMSPPILEGVATRGEPRRERLAEPASGVSDRRGLLWLRAEVAELADAPDSKSGGAHAPCGFDSHLRHSKPGEWSHSSGSHRGRLSQTR